MRSLPLRSIWQIVSEINLAEIQREIDAPVHLLIAADEESDAEQAARRLSSPAADFVHPWITVTDSSGSGMLPQSTEIVPRSPAAQASSPQPSRTSPDCALLISTQLELSSALHSLQQALNSQSIPSLVVVVGPEAKRPESAIARRDEHVRVAIPEWSERAVAMVAATLIQIVPAPLRLPFARRLPPLRPAALNMLIQETSQVNASYSFTTGLGETVPGLNFVLGAGDAIVLTKNQLMMAYKIALVSGKTGSPQQLLGEIVGVLGGGFLFRPARPSNERPYPGMGHRAQGRRLLRRHLGHRQGRHRVGDRRTENHPGVDVRPLPRGLATRTQGRPAYSRQCPPAPPVLH